MGGYFGGHPSSRAAGCVSSCRNIRPLLRRGSLKSLDCAREQSVHGGARRMIDPMHQFKWMPRMGPPGGPTGALRAKARNGRSIRS
jgi:hypothetical protein